MPVPRSVSWRLNWYRQSELEGALLLGRMVRRVRDPYLVGRLTRHCADEARHAWLWTRTLETLGIFHVRIHRTYQSFYLDEISTPRAITEVLALTHVFEHRVHRHFTDELAGGTCQTLPGGPSVSCYVTRRNTSTGSATGSPRSLGQRPF